MHHSLSSANCDWNPPFARCFNRAKNTTERRRLPSLSQVEPLFKFLDPHLITIYIIEFFFLLRSVAKFYFFLDLFICYIFIYIKTAPSCMHHIMYHASLKWIYFAMERNKCS